MSAEPAFPVKSITGDAESGWMVEVNDGVHVHTYSPEGDDPKAVADAAVEQHLARFPSGQDHAAVLADLRDAHAGLSEKVASLRQEFDDFVAQSEKDLEDLVVNLTGRRHQASSAHPPASPSVPSPSVPSPSVPEPASEPAQVPQVAYQDHRAAAMEAMQKRMAAAPAANRLPPNYAGLAELHAVDPPAPEPERVGSLQTLIGSEPGSAAAAMEAAFRSDPPDIARHPADAAPEEAPAADHSATEHT